MRTPHPRFVPRETDKRDWEYAVFLAADAEDLIDFDLAGPSHYRFSRWPGFQMTQFPSELLWGPGAWPDLVSAIDQFEQDGFTDAVEFLDRTFFVRVAADSERPEYPRSSDDVGADKSLVDDHTVWYVVRADFPMDAWAYVRDLREASATENAMATATTLIRRLRGDRAALKYARSWAH